MIPLLCNSGNLRINSLLLQNAEALRKTLFRAPMVVVTLPEGGGQPLVSQVLAIHQ